MKTYSKTGRGLVESWLWELKPFGENVKPGTQIAVGEVLFQNTRLISVSRKKAQSSKEEKAAKLAKKKKGEENAKLDVARLIWSLVKSRKSKTRTRIALWKININGETLQVCSGLFTWLINAQRASRPCR